MLPRVSIRAPLRRATAACAVAMMFSRFQSAPPCGERRPFPPPGSAWRCFNPRPPAESDARFRHQEALGAVSIRAPLRRATPRTGLDDWREIVSIRAPLRRATAITNATRGETECFNPRPPAESDWPPPTAGPSRRFQSAPPCGERRETDAEAMNDYLFQSAPPCGERRSPPAT